MISSTSKPFHRMALRGITGFIYFAASFPSSGLAFYNLNFIRKKSCSGSQTFSTAGSFTFTPTCSTTVTVKVWGAGSSGAGFNTPCGPAKEPRDSAGRARRRRRTHRQVAAGQHRDGRVAARQLRSREEERRLRRHRARSHRRQDPGSGRDGGQSAGS